MSSSLRLIRRIMSTVMVLGGLTFGASALFASPTTTMCLDDGDNFLGTCSGPQECQTKCEIAHPPPEEVEGHCDLSGCCSCFY